MIRWKMILGVALIFILGALVGSTITGYHFKKYYPGSAGFRYEKASLLDKISRELNLTPDQKIQIGEILDRLDEKRQKHIEEITSEVRLAVSQIKKELQPDQQVKFDRLREEFRKRSKSRE